MGRYINHCQKRPQQRPINTTCWRAAYQSNDRNVVVSSDYTILSLTDIKSGDANRIATWVYS